MRRSRPDKAGDFLLAARHNFYWSKKYQLYIRIHTPLEDDSFHLDICPPQEIRGHLGHIHATSDGLLYVVWWELARKGNVVLDGIQPLRERKFLTAASLHVDKTGTLIS